MNECFICGYLGDDPVAHGAWLSRVVAESSDLSRELAAVYVDHRLRLTGRSL